MVEEKTGFEDKKSCVIRTAAKMNVTFPEDTANEEKEPQDRTLGNPLVTWDGSDLKDLSCMKVRVT